MTAPRMSDLSRLAGVMTTAELAAAGVSPGQLHRLVRRGAWFRLAHGVFAPAELVAAEADNPAGEHAVRVAAALAMSRPGAVASHHSAAAIHALELLGRQSGETVALTRPTGTAGCRTGGPGIRLHIAALPAGHVVGRRGLPVTSVARTVIDLARASSFRAGVVAADSALRSRQASKADLDLCITTCASWPGIQNARRVVAFADARSSATLSLFDKPWIGSSRKSDVRHSFRIKVSRPRPHTWASSRKLLP